MTTPNSNNLFGNIENFNLPEINLSALEGDVSKTELKQMKTLPKIKAKAVFDLPTNSQDLTNINEINFSIDIDGKKVSMNEIAQNFGSLVASEFNWNANKIKEELKNKLDEHSKIEKENSAEENEPKGFGLM